MGIKKSRDWSSQMISKGLGVFFGRKKKSTGERKRKKKSISPASGERRPCQVSEVMNGGHSCVLFSLLLSLLLLLFPFFLNSKHFV